MKCIGLNKFHCQLFSEKQQFHVGKEKDLKWNQGYSKSVVKGR